MTDETLETLWRSAASATETFDPARVAELPAAARRYFLHTLAPGTKLATCARLKMHGSLRLGKSWAPFEAEQVLRWDRGFVWRARARAMGLPIVGADRFLDGEGTMRFRLLGIVPVATGEGPDVTRAAAGRFHAEAIWLPAVLLGADVRWSERDAAHPHARIAAHGETSEVDLTLDETGALRAVSLPRWWTAPTGPSGHYEPFGGTCGDDRTFDGVTIPTTYSLGWFWGTDRYASEGEFFRCTIDSLEQK
ncbi:MAG: DUF6544 family protein [Sandaracinus sp.]